jgi:heme/copper-type cytochrome/quinol oxidase subunit 3
MALAYSAVGQGAIGRFRAWLVVTAVLGLLFASAQAYEFHHYYHIGVTMESSPFGSAFFTLVGFHGLHVLFGVFWLVSVLIFSFRPVFRDEATVKVRALGLYWHFVDVVWVVIFTFVYLMGKVG